MFKKGLISIVILILAGAFASTGQAKTPGQTNQLLLTTLATGFSDITDLAHAGDARLFVVTQSGQIHLISAEGTVLETPFLDIRNRVEDGSNEQGLLGLAFHPDYANNGYFYVNYTNANSPSGRATRIARYSVSADDPNLADPDSELTILDVDQDFSNHNGGDLNFGPDGYLYIGLGDGGSSNDPNNNAQTGTSLLGKMLRLDLDSATPYAIPSDNPFVDDDTVRDEVWAVGLRNPWRFSFDRQTGDMYIGDVGQRNWEEISFQPASSTGGENYGWRCYEGFVETPTLSVACTLTDPHTEPIFAYPHSTNAIQGCSVTGGYVYRGQNYPALQGHYIFADYCTADIWALTQDEQDAWQIDVLASGLDRITTFGETHLGELLVAERGGTVYQLSLLSPQIYLPLLRR